MFQNLLVGLRSQPVAMIVQPKSGNKGEDLLSVVPVTDKGMAEPDPFCSRSPARALYMVGNPFFSVILATVSIL